jgi:DNA-binding MarR family transcriptional regulator
MLGGVSAEPDGPELEWAARLRLVLGPLVRQLRRVSTEPYTPTQLSVIGAIERLGPIALGDLADHERLSPPTITKVVAALEADGLIERLADPADRRVCQVALTADGERRRAAGRDRRDRWLATRIAGLSGSERAAVAVAVPALERLLGPDD